MRDPYKFSMENALEDLRNGVGRGADEVWIRVPTQGSLSIDTNRVQFTVDPRFIGLEIVELTGRKIADWCLRELESKKLEQLEEREIHKSREFGLLSTIRTLQARIRRIEQVYRIKWRENE